MNYIGSKYSLLPFLEEHILAFAGPQTERTLFDSVALSLAVLPLLLFWVTIVTAPMALFVAVRYWQAPSSILPRTKIRMVVAIVVASLEIVAWACGITYLVTR